MNLKVPIGYKFILGFIAVVAAAAFVPRLVAMTEVTEWLREPLSFLTAIVVGLILGTMFTRSFTKHFGLLTEMAKKISRGELAHTGKTGAATRLFTDEATELEEALLLMITNLKGLVGHVKDVTNNLSEAQEVFNALVSKGGETSREVISGTSKIFDGAHAQANHVESTSRTVRDMTELSD
jgi:methyl-accepting chemotaxis protein